MPAALHHQDIDAGDGLSLHVSRSGTGPPVVLLHGFTGSAETWEPLRAALEDSYSVIGIDLPGHGRSSSPADPRRYALERFSMDLAQVLDVLDADRIALMGYSMGGRAALRFALSRPDRIAALILESTSPGIDDETSRRERRAADDTLAGMIERDGIESFVDHWESLSLWETQQNVPADERLRLRTQRLSSNPAGLANSLRGAGSASVESVTGRLSGVTVPTLAIAGALDLRYVEHARVIAGAIDGGRLAIIEQSGHSVHFERPDLLAGEVSRFLGTIQSSGDRWL